MGIIFDISHHQVSSKIDWVKLGKQADFGIIRVQYGSSTIDREYKNHVANAKKVGIPFGHYAYGRYVSVEDAKVEARDFLSRIDKEAKFLALDVEKDTITSCGTEKLAEASQAFIDVCKDSGYKVGLYVSHEIYKKYGMDKVKADFLWLPRYGSDNGTPSKKPDYTCDLWQYSQNCKVDWYPYGVDLNLLNSEKTVKWFVGEENVVEPEETKVDAEIITKPSTPKTSKRKKNSDGTYTVKSGDTLSAISSDFKVSIDNLVKWNSIKNKNIISVGQKLKLTAPKTSTKTTTSTGTYKIKSGDTLSEIAVKYNTTVSKLKSLNGLKNDTIYAGKTLKVPTTSTTKTSAKSTSSTKYHTVNSGDTVSELAVKYGSTIAKIKSWNKLNSKYTIYVGQKLRVK